jgi:acetyl-CoA carboxylase carboxyl transferase subunit alpha
MRYLDFERPLVDLQRKIDDLINYANDHSLDLSTEIESLKKALREEEKRVFGGLTPYQRIKLARHPERPYMLDFVRRIFTDFYELHGDRAFRDDAAIVSGIACLGQRRVALVGHQKGRNTEENIRRNFGMANPEGFRKALRVMKMAERFQMPVISFVDSSGAYPGIGAEERGQSEAIATNLMEMSQLRVPVIVVVTGEGGSGGALAIGIGNRILMFENSYYAVCTPEACAAILWKDGSKAPEAAPVMKILSADLKEMNIIDEILREPFGGAHRDVEAMAEILQEALERNIDQLSEMSGEQLAQHRYERFRHLGQFIKKAPSSQAVVA